MLVDCLLLPEGISGAAMIYRLFLTWAEKGRVSAFSEIRKEGFSSKFALGVARKL